MAITAGELSILLTAKNEMSKVLRDVQGDMKQTERKGNALSGAFAAIRNVSLAGAGGIIAIGSALGGLALKAAPVADLRKAFYGIADDGDAMIRALQEGAYNMISAEDAMRSYNLGAMLVSKTFADELPEAMGFLSKVSHATGEDMGHLMESLVKGVGRLSPMILDNLAIQVDLTSAYEDYAAELGITVEEMTKTEQQAAVMAQVMEKLRENTAAMPDVTNSMNQMLKEAKASFKDAKLEIGLAFLPIMEQLAKTVLPMALEALAGLVPLAQKLAAWMGERLPQAIAVISEWMATHLPVAIEKAREAISVIWGFLKDNLRPILAVVAAAFVTWGITAVAAAVSTVVALAPVILAIGAVVGAAILLYKAWDSNFMGIRDILKEVWEGHLQPAFEQLRTWLQTNIPKAIQALTGFWTNTLLPAIKIVWAFIQDNLIPIFVKLVEFSIAKVKVELGILAWAWENVLLPAIKMIWAFIQDPLIPLLGRLVDWLGVNIPKAIEALKGFWENTLLPAIKKVWEFIQDPLIPLFEKLVEWLQVNIPKAIEALKGFWENTLLPAIKAVWTFIQDPLIPLFEKLVEWLQVSIPKAIETLKGFWTNTLLPAMDQIVKFVKDNLRPILAGLATMLLLVVVPAFFAWAAAAGAAALAVGAAALAAVGALLPVIAPILAIGAAVGLLVAAWDKDWGGMRTTLTAFWEDTVKPILETLKAWLEVNIPKAIEILTDFWTNTLLPAITDVWKFVQDDLIPLFKALADLFDAALTLAVTAMAGLWDKVLEPAIKSVWKIIDEKVLPVLRTVAEFLSGKLTEAFNAIKDKVLGPVQEKFEKVGGAIGGISGAVKDAIGWIGGLAEKLRGLTLPDWLTPGSPTPFEIGLRGISDALSDVVPWMRSMDTAIPDAGKLGESAGGFAKLASAIAGMVKSFGDISTGIGGSTSGGLGLEQMVSFVTEKVIPLMTALHRAFKYELPKLMDESVNQSMRLWADRMASIGKTLQGAVTASKLVFDAAEGFAKWAGWSLELIHEAIVSQLVPVIRGIHSAFKTLPILDETEVISESLAIWAKRYQSIAPILDGAIKASEAVFGAAKGFSKWAGWSLELIHEAIVDQLFPVIRGIHAAFKTLPILDETEVISDSLAIWAKRYASITPILDGATKASAAVFDAAKGFGKWGGRSLESIRDTVIEQLFPVIRGIHAAFKTLPILDETEVIGDSLAIWAKRYAGIASILDGATKASALVFDAAGGFSKWAGWSLEAIRDAVVEQLFPAIRGIHAAFKTLPLLDETETISASLKIWQERFSAIAGMVLDVFNISETLSDGYVSPDLAVIDRIALDAANVMNQVLMVFSQMTRDIDTLNSLYGPLAIQANLVGTAIGIINTMLGLNSLDKYASPDLDIIDRIATDAANVMNQVLMVFSQMTRDIDTLNSIYAPLAIQANLVGTALGIISTMLGLGDLGKYVSPDMAKIDLVVADAKAVTDKVLAAINTMGQTAEEMQPDIELLEAFEKQTGSMVEIIENTIEVAKGLSEMSWREVQEHQVSSFTKNLANIVGWLTDPVGGISAIVGINDMTAYQSATNSLGAIVTNVVEAVREIMTLPAVWDNRITAISEGLVKFFTDIMAAVNSSGSGFVEAWRVLASAAITAFSDGFTGVSMNSVWANIIAGMARVLNDGVFRSQGYRNALAYKSGWEAGMGIASPSKVSEGWGRSIVAGLDKGMSSNVTNNYNLTVNTTQPAVNVVSSFRMLEATG